MGSAMYNQEHINDLVKKLYNLNKEAKYIGYHSFSAPSILVRDLDLIKSVLVKNFENFAYHREFVEEVNDPLLGKNLAFLNGSRWKEVRNLLSPAFTFSKMRGMFVTMANCAENFTEQFINLHGHKEAIDMKDAFTRYANDVIATCAFGIEVDSIKNPDNDFFIHGKLSSLSTTAARIRFMFVMFFPSLSRKLGARVITKKVTNFFVNVIKTTIKVRDEKGISRPDMLQLMMDARGKSLANDMNLLEITAQAFIFFLGGFETTSDNMCMIAYELAVNPDIQKKLQNEIDEMMKQCGNKPTYESVNNLTYLDAVFMETLRKHPLAFLSRICSKEFELPPTLPNSKPFLVKSGMEVTIPVAGIHDDTDYYEDPEKFFPERNSNKKAVSSDVLSLGFGLGPRMCIGNRFAILETKVLFVNLLSKCNIVPCKKTCIPLEYDPPRFSPAVKGGCWLKLESRS